MKNSRRRTCIFNNVAEEIKLAKTSTPTLFPAIQSLQLSSSSKPTSSSAHKPFGANPEILSCTISSKPPIDDACTDRMISDRLPALQKVRNLRACPTKLATIKALETSQQCRIEAEEESLRREVSQTPLYEVNTRAKSTNSRSSWPSDYAQMQVMVDSHRYSRAYLGLSALMLENSSVVGRVLVLSAMRAFCSYQIYNYAECADDSQTCWRLLTDARPGEELAHDQEDKSILSAWLNARFVLLWSRSLILCEEYDEARMLYNRIFSQEMGDQAVFVSNIFNLTESDLSLLQRERDCIPQICSFRQYVETGAWSSALSVMKSKSILEFLEATSLRFLEALVLFENGQLDAAREVLLSYLARMPFSVPPSSSSGNAKYWCKEEKQLQHYIERAYLNANLFLSKVGLYCGREYMNIAAVLIQRCLAVDPLYTPALKFGCHLVALEDFISEAESDIEEGRFQNAVTLITDTLAMDSKNNRINAFLFVMRAEAYLKLCRPLQAIEDCTSSIGLDAAHAKAYFMRSIALQRVQKTAEAAADRCMAAKLNSSYCDIHEATELNSSGSQATFFNERPGSNHRHFPDKKSDVSKGTLYDTLGVRPCASLEDIRQAFKRLTLQYHPDKVVNESEDFQRIAIDRFKELNQAHSVLTDPEKRSVYDLSLRRT